MDAFRLVFIVLAACLIYGECRQQQQYENICKEAQKFKFDGLQVNGVYNFTKEYEFDPIEDYTIDEKCYEFERWDCPFNKTMSTEDLELYNQHIIKIYSESFFQGDVDDFYRYKKYITNIRKSFIDSKHKIIDKCEPSVGLDKYGLEDELQKIIDKMYTGYKLLDCFTKIKENKLCEEVYPVSDLRSDIDSLAIKNTNRILSFRNKTLDYYYSQPLILYDFTIKRGSENYVSLKSTGKVRINFIALPVHDKNYDATQPCLELDQLPEFYQSV